MKFNDLVGKTITGATLMKKKDYDDQCWLKLDFSDDTACILVGSYGDYTGASEDDYPAFILITAADDEEAKELSPVKCTK